VSGRDDGWPLIGRDEELDLLRRLRSSVPSVSAVISGPAGVGKSRLAATALAEAAKEGWATLAIRGSSGYAVVPLGPLRTVLQVPDPRDPAELTASVEHELLDMRTARGLFVLADDAQHLDDVSAALLHQLAANGSLLAIVTTRTGTALPAAFTDLWKDGLAERMDLLSLSRRESAELLTVSLGGHVRDSTAHRIWQVTDGNPLYLRELVHSGQETGALTKDGGEWRWHGEWAAGGRLQEIVAARLGRLTPDEATAMEMLAVAGYLPLDLVTRVATTSVVQTLEERGLITSGRSGRRLEVSIVHPIHAEVLRGTLPALRQRAIRQNLVDALRSGPNRRSEDIVRIACWSIESGVDIDPMTLSLGSDASLFGIGHSVSARLHEIQPGREVPLPAGRPAVRQDFEVALRLAEVAYERSGTTLDGFALAEALGWVGETRRAEVVLAELAKMAEQADDRLRLAMAVGWIRFWCHFDAQGATEVLTRAIADLDADSDPKLVAEIFQELAGVSLNTAHPAEGLAQAEAAAAALGVDLAASNAAAVGAASLSYMGRQGDAIAVTDRAVPIAHEHGHPLDVATLLFVRTGALARYGRLEEAAGLASWLRNVALSDELLEAAGIFGVLLGEVLLRQGQAATAGRIFRDSSGLMAERDVLGYRPWALTGLARARAQLGQYEDAAAALAEALRIRTIARHYEISVFLARVETHKLQGDVVAAEGAAREGADWAMEAGMLVDEAIALDACVRLSAREADAVRLTELASSTDSELVSALAAYANAVVAADPGGMLDTSERFAGMTAWWAAADAADAAARILERRHLTRRARAAARVAADCAGRCEGYRSSAPGSPVGPTRLTKREGEVARLAVAGKSNREIALALQLSPRTVENHLQRAFVKLGVTDRSALADAFPGSTTE
jgi:DNA-binding CsgD family transcriptional regulator